jgi:hypothetical protein
MEGVIKNVAICAPFMMSRDTNCTAIEPKMTRIAPWNFSIQFPFNVELIREEHITWHPACGARLLKPQKLDKYLVFETDFFGL